jgi:hypothetical protein
MAPDGAPDLRLEGRPEPATYEASAFGLVDAVERMVGLALICVPCRYASLLRQGATRIERVVLSPADWRAVGQEARDGLPPGLLDDESAVGRVLGRLVDPTIQVRWLHTTPATVATPESAAQVLDARLRGLTG